MPELDEMFRLDAENDDAPPAFGNAIARARTATRRRHSLLAGGTACVAIAACGGLLYAGTSAGGGAARGQVKLASYDRVLGPDRAHPGNSLVFGPDDEHTANCTKLPSSDVTVYHFADGTVGYEFKDYPGDYVADLDSSSHAPYYFFSCPIK